MQHGMQQQADGNAVFVKELEHAVNDERPVVHRGFNHARAVGVTSEYTQLQRLDSGGEKIEGFGGDREPLLQQVTIAEIRWQSLEQAVGKDAEAPLIFELVAGFLLSCFGGQGRSPDEDA